MNYDDRLIGLQPLDGLFGIGGMMDTLIDSGYRSVGRSGARALLHPALAARLHVHPGSREHASGVRRVDVPQ
jgi:hypothetical protein